LPAADANGLCDAYCEARLGGEVIKSRRQEKTLNPQFNETLAFDRVDLPTNLNITAPLSMSEKSIVQF